MNKMLTDSQTGAAKEYLAMLRKLPDSAADFHIEQLGWMLQHLAPAPAREPDGDVVQEALRTFHSVPWGHRLASDELGDLGDRKWREGMAAVVGMLRAKHEAELQSLREQHQKDINVICGDVGPDDKCWREAALFFNQAYVYVLTIGGLREFLRLRRALIAKDAPKEIEIPEGMLKAAYDAEADLSTEESATIPILQAALRWQRDNQPASEHK